MKRIVFECPTLDLSFEAELDEKNPKLVNAVADTLPLESVLGHVVVSGGGIWAPTKLVFLEEGEMRERQQGTVYFYAPGQTICLTYGDITESAFVNKFAQVVSEDLSTLQRVGELVYQHTVTNPQRQQVPVKISLSESEGA